jgi:transposase
MSTLTLTEREVDDLQRLERSTHDAKQLKRIQALLAVGQGGSPTAVARQLRIGRSTLYEWIDRFLELRSNLDGSTRSLPRSGRPIRQRRSVQERVVDLLAKPPSDFGFRHICWTKPLFQEQLRREGLKTSQATIGRALHDAGYRWKRPRYVLARRSKTWRQAKGGSAPDSRTASVP